MKPICGVYRIYHIPTKSSYVGGSVRVMKRWNDHERMLDDGEHKCKALQKLWDSGDESEFRFELLESCNRISLRGLEDKYARLEKKLIGRMNSGFSMLGYITEKGKKILSNLAKERHKNCTFGHATWDDESRKLASKSAKRRIKEGKFGGMSLWKSGTRKKLSKLAKKQHQEGNFGVATWSSETRKNMWGHI